MSRMSGPARRYWYEILLRRDGERCFIGGEAGSPETLIIDHFNGDDSDNRPSNLHLLCRQMNSVKNPRGNAVLRQHPDEDQLLSSMHVRRVECEEVVKSIIRKAQSSELIKNLAFEPNFKHWLFYCIVHLPRLNLDKVVVNGAANVGCSDDSIKRYVKRLVCAAGLYRLEVPIETGSQLISLKPKWESFRKRNEENARLNLQARNWKKSADGRMAKGNILLANPLGREANGKI